MTDIKDIYLSWICQNLKNVGKYWNLSWKLRYNYKLNQKHLISVLKSRVFKNSFKWTSTAYFLKKKNDLNDDNDDNKNIYIFKLERFTELRIKW